jgi:L-threonylcarbamoyladenylate synthase
VASAWPEAVARLAERFWPGPLTLVLPRRDEVPDAVTAGGPTVAVRLPAHAVARALIRAAGVPVAAPSANRSAQLSPTRAEHVLTGLDGRIDLLLDGGPTAGGLESTVLDVTAAPPRLLRPGLVTPAEIEVVLGGISRGAPAGAAPGEPLPSPGMLRRHYAPRTVLECVEDDGRARVEELRRDGVSVGWVTLGDVPGPLDTGVRVVAMPRDAKGYARSLYAALHLLDAQGVGRIVVALPPDADEWLAVRDRLRRAATPG